LGERTGHIGTPTRTRCFPLPSNIQVTIWTAKGGRWVVH
jgi:hypothetical protein